MTLKERVADEIIASAKVRLGEIPRYATPYGDRDPELAWRSHITLTITKTDKLLQKLHPDWPIIKDERQRRDYTNEQVREILVHIQNNLQDPDIRSKMRNCGFNAADIANARVRILDRNDKD